MDSTFGKYFAELRREGLELSLRKFCEQNDYDPGNISKVELGVLAPPSSPSRGAGQTVALGLQDGSESWNHFFDLAASEKGRIPHDVMEDQEVVQMLPALFRTLRGSKVDRKKLQQLADLIKQS